jgi:hypothetical protein
MQRIMVQAAHLTLVKEQREEREKGLGTRITL